MLQSWCVSLIAIISNLDNSAAVISTYGSKLHTLVHSYVLFSKNLVLNDLQDLGLFQCNQVF